MCQMRKKNFACIREIWSSFFKFTEMKLLVYSLQNHSTPQSFAGPPLCNTVIIWRSSAAYWEKLFFFWDTPYNSWCVKSIFIFWPGLVIDDHGDVHQVYERHTRESVNRMDCSLLFVQQCMYQRQELWLFYVKFF